MMDKLSSAWLQIEQAAAGCVSGTLQEWPALDLALRDCGYDLAFNTPATILKAICQHLVGVRDSRQRGVGFGVKPELYDLVNCDGYFGIMVAENEVFLGNGLRMVLEPEEVDRLFVLPIYASRAVVDNPLTARANFRELFERQA